MNNPEVKFKIDKKIDWRMFKRFKNHPEPRFIKWALISRFPKWKCYRTKKGLEMSDKIAEQAIDKFYKDNKELMKKNKTIYEKEWKGFSDMFFKLVEETFGDTVWPTGKYISYLTMWGVFPRFLKDKTLAVACDYKNKKGYRYVFCTVAHELLHFKFFNYFYSKRWPIFSNGSKNKKVRRNDEFNWHVSEIFNEILQTSPKWLKVFNIGPLVYPEHNEILKKLKLKYYKKNKIKADDLIIDIMKEASKVW